MSIQNVLSEVAGGVSLLVCVHLDDFQCDSPG